MDVEELMDGIRAARQISGKEKSESFTAIPTPCPTKKEVKESAIMYARATIQEGTLALTKEITRKSILLVDADEPLRLVLGMLLENEGYAVTTCGNEVAAIDLIERNPFDFIISDHSSSGVDGLRLLETVKQRDTHTPVLLIASLFEMGPYIEAMNLGALDYISKPVDYAEVQRLVTSHC